MSSDTNATDKKAPPSHIAYLVTQKEGEKPDWQKAGAAWANKEGGLNLKLENMPTHKSLVLRPAKKRDGRSLSYF